MAPAERVAVPRRSWHTGLVPLTLTHPGWDPVAVRLGPLQIHWYALMYLLGFVIAYVLLRRRLHHPPFDRISKPRPWVGDDVENLLIASIVGVMVGGRLGYCLFYQPGHYLTYPLEMFFLWEGGMSFHGGAIGVTLALLMFALRAKRPFLEVTDLLVPAVPLGLAVGRIGNFINGELWGRPTAVPWGMIFPMADSTPRHPSQLYQFALEGLLLFVLLWAYARRERALGEVSAFFLVGYGLFRFIAEFFREPDDFLGLLSFNLSMGQWLSIPMVMAGLLLWAVSRRRGVHAPSDVSDRAIEEQDADGDAPEAGGEPEAENDSATSEESNGGVDGELVAEPTPTEEAASGSKEAESDMEERSGG